MEKTMCVLDETKECDNCMECETCDLDPDKICDNCGKCLEIKEFASIKIDKIYITGMASVINNIDIYFQEYLEDVKCEILRPYFIRSIGSEINIKDYIEVNSAIALALQGVGEGLKGINFKKENVGDKLPAWMTMEIGGKGKSRWWKFNWKL